MIFGEGDVPLLFLVAGLFLQLLAAFVLLRIRLIAIRGLQPGGDAFLLGCLGVRIARGCEIQFHAFG